MNERYFRLTLQTLIIIWWIGAITAASALLIPIYEQYVVIGLTGWIVVIASTALIIYEIKRIKEEGKNRQLAEKGG